LEADGSIPPVLGSILGDLVNLCDEGFVSVVFTVSDLRVIRSLEAVSGHSDRLKVDNFPSMPDDVMVGQLSKLAVEIPGTNKKTPLQQVFSKLAEAGTKYWTFGEGDSVIPLFPKNEDAKKIVEHFDSHMGATTECLRAVISGASVIDAVDTIVKKAEGGIIDALMGDSCGEADRSTYIVAAHLLFEDLENEDIVKWSTVVRKHVPGINSAELSKAVQQLVKNNLLSYADKLYVGLHSRRLKWAYKNVRADNDIKYNVEEALAHVKAPSTVPLPPTTK